MSAALRGAILEDFLVCAGKPTDRQAFPRNLAPGLWGFYFLKHTFGHLGGPVMASERVEAST